MRYVLTLEPKPGIDDTRALRAALKALGRRFGLRCIAIREENGHGTAIIARRKAPVRKIEPQAIA